MKKLFLLIASSMLCAAIMIGCGGPSTQTPEVVAEKYMKALFKQNYRVLYKYASENEAVKLAEQQENMKKKAIPAEKQQLLNNFAKAKMEAQPAQIDEATPDKALVNVNYTVNDGSKETSGVWKLKLVKQENGWKVDDLAWK